MLQKRGKKAVIEIQFNWIFVLLVGAVILIFFINLASRQKDTSEKKLAVELLADLELIVTGQSVSIGRSNAIEMPPVELGFTCDDYRIGPQTRRIGNTVILSPATIQGPRLITWTRDWLLPYRVTNFVYLTSSSAKYYFVAETRDDLGLIERMVAELPDEMDVTVVLRSDLKDMMYENNYYVTFIFFNIPPQPIPPQFLSAKLRALSLDFQNQAEEQAFQGNVKLSFFHWQDAAWTEDNPGVSIDTLDKGMVYAAIFAEDFSSFHCNLEKGLERYIWVSEIYTNRAIRLQQVIKQDCAFVFNKAIPHLAAITAEAEKARENLPAFDSTTLFQNIRELLARNDEAVLRSCPTLY